MTYEKDGKLILFGAGVYAKKYKALLEYLHMDFDYFIDNDSSKWGTELYGKLVISPSELKSFQDCKIIISSTHEIAIRKQLFDIGLEDSIIGLEELYDLCTRCMDKQQGKHRITHNQETIIVDMYEGIGWGGTELWAANLAYGLNKAGKQAMLLGGMEQPLLDELYEALTIRIAEQETIMHMVDLFERNLPCIFVNNFAGCAFMAAVIVKKKYPNLIKIVSVIHNDNKSLFDAHMMLAEYIDKVFCVSIQIRKHMQKLYDFEKEKYYFKEQPIDIDLLWEREENQTDALRIGYAARLVKQQKRAELLVDFIAHLEEKNMDYLFQIAGEGECAESIVTYISQNGLQNRVQLLGRLPKSKMDDFWKAQDVFVNVSEYEGTSLSMLEAMAFGCVPVVTDVSGAREFIEEGENGYICDVGDIEGIAECVAELAENRDRLKIYGEKSRNVILERCNSKNYIDYWMENLL